MRAMLLSQKAGRIHWLSKEVAQAEANNTNSSIVSMRDVGIIFQAFNLIPHYTTLENVMLSLELCGSPYKHNYQRSLELLNKLGIDRSKACRKVLKLSGGEQQRVAISRALAPNPELILADEPTGNLDSKTGDKIMEKFIDIAHNENRCIIIVTHSSASS